MKVQSLLRFLSRPASCKCLKNRGCIKCFTGLWFPTPSSMCSGIPWKQRIHQEQTHWLHSPPLFIGQCWTPQLPPAAQTSVVPPADHRRIYQETPKTAQQHTFDLRLGIWERWTWGTLLWDQIKVSSGARASAQVCGRISSPCWSHWGDWNGTWNICASTSDVTAGLHLKTWRLWVWTSAGSYQRCKKKKKKPSLGSRI